jgi:F-type H+-transporting ATPase subunit epsilon
MPNSMQVEVVSPEKVLFSGEATMVVTRTVGNGDVAFQPGHAPFLGAVTECHTRIYLVDGSVQDVAVHGGFVQVDGKKVSLLSDAAELRDQIDVGRAQASKAKAEDAASVRRANARLAAAGAAH